VTVTLRSSILDPQGKTVRQALENLAMPDVKEVRIGKVIEIMLASRTKEEAIATTELACKKLLANPVMEEYSYTVEAA